MFAVIKTGGKQYKVAAGDILTIERLSGNSGDAVQFDDVLMVSDGGSSTIGAPLVDGASVAAELVEQKRGRRIIIFKKRRRKNSRRRNGHRQDLSMVRITEILTDGAKPKPAKKAVAEEKEAPADSVAPEDIEAPPVVEADAATEATEAVLAPLFDTPEGDADDLKKISGVGPVLEEKLNALGISQFAQIAGFSKEDTDRVDEVLNFKGRVERDGWVEQAAKLAAGETPDQE